MARGLTKKQRGFIKDIIKTGNATKAALNNYDIESDNEENVAASIGSENLMKPAIKEALRLLKQDIKLLTNKEKQIRSDILDSVFNKFEIESLIQKEEDFYKYVYVLNCGIYYKIGIAANLSDRLNQIQNGNPYPVSIVFAIKHKKAKMIEKELHIYFADKQERREWFKLTDEDLVQIRAFINSYE